MRTSAWPLINTIHITTLGVTEITSTRADLITIRTTDITMMTIFSKECFSAHLIKLK